MGSADGCYREERSSAEWVLNAQPLPTPLWALGRLSQGGRSTLVFLLDDPSADQPVHYAAKEALQALVGSPFNVRQLR